LCSAKHSTLLTKFPQDFFATYDFAPVGLPKGLLEPRLVLFVEIEGLIALPAERRLS
jgi:hypothetical protein